jgi:hypothetical protein
LQEVGGGILHDTDLSLSIADDDGDDDNDPQHTAKRLLKMHTNRYENRKAKELNLEWICKKQAQLQPPTSTKALNILSAALP